MSLNESLSDAASDEESCTTIQKEIEIIGTLRVKNNRRVIVKGSVQGQIESDGVVEVDASGRVDGKICTQALIVSGRVQTEQSVIVRGRLTMQKGGVLIAKLIRYGDLEQCSGSRMQGMLEPYTEGQDDPEDIPLPVNIVVDRLTRVAGPVERAAAANTVPTMPRTMPAAPVPLALPVLDLATDGVTMPAKPSIAPMPIAPAVLRAALHDEQAAQAAAPPMVLRPERSLDASDADPMQDITHAFDTPAPDPMESMKPKRHSLTQSLSSILESRPLSADTEGEEPPRPFAGIGAMPFRADVANHLRETRNFKA